MKTLFYSLFLFTTTLTFSQETSSLFHDKIFMLKHFIQDGEIEELDLVNPNDPSGNTTRGIPGITFSFDTSDNLLEAFIGGYCNATSAKYIVHTDYLEVVTRGATTLTDCGGGEEAEYFQHLTGTLNWQQPSGNINFLFNDSKSELILWLNENRKMVFEEDVLNVDKNDMENHITIYPNPIKDVLYINTKATNLLELNIIDFQGRVVLKKSKNLAQIDISHFSSGVYYVKLTSDKNISIIKKIVKQ